MWVCVGVVITFSVSVVIGLVVADDNGKAGGIRLGCTLGCIVTLSSGDACLGSLLMLLILIAALGAFSCLGLL